ncbi:hypothetical protein HPB47_025465 [Ixodes persulcatus]|uniref:Uncharacterized protein n=1 Tax=Ixodes persulcatus TaxID=34615 RepID=A0AC60Q1D5_IXOPE|nr:hypothetical protein HPB47_025465 [Ixodes persulcatus]
MSGRLAASYALRVSDALRHLAFSCLGVVLTTGLIVTSLVLLRFSGAIGRHRSASSWDACDSKLCLTHVRRLRESLDEEARPCDNFYTFACGSWRPRLPGALTALRDMLAVDRMDVLRHLQPGSATSAGSKQPGLNKAERSYQACLRSRQRDVSSLVDFLRNRGLSWPDRRPARIHPVDVLVDLDVNWNLGLWFTVRLVRRSSKDKRLIRIGEGIVSGAWRKFIRQLAARGHYKDYTSAGGASLDEWMEANSCALYNGDQILVTNVKLLQALDRLCQLSSPEDILRYISWTVVQLLGWMADPTLPGRPQSAAAEDSRSVDCFWAVDRVFGLASWSSYITSRFPPAVRADVDRILSSVVQSTVDMLLRSSWIDNATKEVAVHKVRNIQTFLWPPEEFFNATETADLLKPFPDPSDSVISSWLRASIVRRGLLGRAGFESLLDADSDLRSLFRYRYYVNELAVSLTAVSSPLYIQGATSALNYGGLGVHYATTLARAFDHKGVLVDALGRGRLWWSRASYPAYESKSSCRGGDGAESTNTDMDGVTALGIAYDAFNVNRALSSRKISDAKFLGMSEDQVFFVGFCQAFCASIPTEQQRSSCDTPLKNSGEFARAFNCPLNSPMNPSVKCSFFDDAGERSRPSASVATIRTPHLGEVNIEYHD